MAIHDFGLSDEVFGGIDVPFFRLLWQRRTVAFNQQCYLHGLTASAVYNSRRTSWEQHVFGPADFIPRTARENQHDEIVLTLRRELSYMPADKIPEARKRWFDLLKEKEIPEVEEVLLEVFGGLGG